MLDNMCRFLKTDTVDCESRRIQFGSMPAEVAWASMYASWTSVVPVVVVVVADGESAVGHALA